MATTTASRIPYTFLKTGDIAYSDRLSHPNDPYEIVGEIALNQFDLKHIKTGRRETVFKVHCYSKKDEWIAKRNADLEKKKQIGLNTRNKGNNKKKH